MAVRLVFARAGGALPGEARGCARRGGARRAVVQDREAVFREHSLVFHMAAAELEQAEWLASKGRAEDAEPLLAEARETFERLECDAVARAFWRARTEVEVA